MSNPTSNFNWQMPTATDLVTDLPADFEVFGQAVDSSLADLKGGTTGQILAKNTNTDMDFVWVTNDVGDITAVTAGTGISGGGTSGAVTITNAMATEIAAKGDLIVGTGSQTFDNLTAGANNTVLTADSTTATGLKWAVPGAATPTSGNASVSAFETTTSTSYTDLTTSGPACTVTTGTKALVIFGANISNNNSGSVSLMDFAVSGATTRAADDLTSGMMTAPGTGNNQFGFSRAVTLTGLTAGSNTFTMKYRQAGSVGQFGNRFITVIDLGS